MIIRENKGLIVSIILLMIGIFLILSQLFGITIIFLLVIIVITIFFRKTNNFGKFTKLLFFLGVIALIYHYYGGIVGQVNSFTKSIEENKEVIITAENMLVTQEGGGTYKLENDSMMMFIGGVDTTIFTVSTEVRNRFPLVCFKYGGDKKNLRSYFQLNIVDTQENMLYRSADFNPIYFDGDITGDYCGQYRYGKRFALNTKYGSGHLAERGRENVAEYNEYRSFRILLFVHVSPGESVFLKDLTVTGKK